MQRVRLAKVFYGATSMLTLAIGVAIIAKPDCQALDLWRVIGATLLLCGTSRLFGYFSHAPYWLAFQFDLARGLITLILGIVMLLVPHRAVDYLEIIIGVYVATSALFTIQTSLESKRFGIRQWWSFAIGGALTGLVGLALLTTSFAEAYIAHRFIGLALVAEGIQNLLIDLFAVSGRTKKPYE